MGYGLGRVLGKRLGRRGGKGTDGVLSLRALPGRVSDPADRKKRAAVLSPGAAAEGPGLWW